MSFPHQVFPDNFMRREILSLVVQCTYVELGCKWKGEVRHLEVLYSVVVLSVCFVIGFTSSFHGQVLIKMWS